MNACALGKFENAALCVALVENGIRRKITGGENKGFTLSMDNIVLDFQYLSEISGATGVEFRFNEKPDAKRKMSVVAFVQQIDSMSILGAHSTPVRALGQVPRLTAGACVEGDHIPQPGRIRFCFLDL